MNSLASGGHREVNPDVNPTNLIVTTQRDAGQRREASLSARPCSCPSGAFPRGSKAQPLHYFLATPAHISLSQVTSGLPVGAAVREVLAAGP